MSRGDFLWQVSLAEIRFQAADIIIESSVACGRNPAYGPGITVVQVLFHYNIPRIAQRIYLYAQVARRSPGTLFKLVKFRFCTVYQQGNDGQPKGRMQNGIEGFQQCSIVVRVKSTVRGQAAGEYRNGY